MLPTAVGVITTESMGRRVVAEVEVWNVFFPARANFRGGRRAAVGAGGFTASDRMRVLFLLVLAGLVGRFLARDAALGVNLFVKELKDLKRDNSSSYFRVQITK